MTYEKTWDDIIAENKALKNKAEKLGINNTVLKFEIEKLSNAKEKGIQTLTKEQMQCKNYNTELEMKLQTCQNQVKEMNFKHEQEIRIKDRQIDICSGHLSKHMQINIEKDEIISSNDKKYRAEIDHLRQCIKDLKIKNDPLVDEGNKTCDTRKLLDKKKIELSDETEEVLKTLFDIDMQLDAVISPQKTYTEALSMHVDKCVTKYDDIGKTCCMKEVALSIKNKIKLLPLYHIENEMCQMKTHNEILENGKGRAEKDRREQEVECAEMMRKLKESDEQVVVLQKKNAELQKDSSKYDQHQTDQLDTINTKSVTVKQKNVKLVMEEDKLKSELNRTIIELRQKISDLTDTEKSLDLDVREKDNRVSMLNDELEKCTEMVKTKEIELREMENKLQTVKSNLNNDSNFCKKEIAQKEKMLVKINERMNKMEAIVEDLGKEVKAKDVKIDDLATELQQRLEHHNKTQKNLENIINSKEKLVLDLEKKVEQRDSKIYRLGKKLEQDSSGNIHDSKHKTDAAVTNEISDLKKQLNHTLSKLHDTQAELDDTKTRLSKAMGNRLTDNNPNITDLSDRNRPTKLAEKCAELYDNQWTDAFEILEKYFSTDEAVIESLLHVLQVTMNFCRNTAEHQLEELERTLQFADKHGHVLTKALETEEFTFECLELCWFMMVNDPPVAFAPLLAKGTQFNSDLYKPYTSSGTHVEYVVWPALLLHEGGPILAKGVAQGINKSKKNALN
ncbi:repetitive organellar protein-like [Ruditapes philippinarum]|uniref:repetitive organellar protein-like n=1 Tax=Ruditapes philippinarum TaxID=129788 RepID=UPI00295A5FDC|nr:repetitive organellar protein-like [Ruditapes philippinarum]